jgi:RNA polymerase sigma-70 factor, ECF subfamily
MNTAAPSEQPAEESPAAIDAGLLARIAQGDREALGKLYDRYSRPLYAAVLRILNDAREAEDIVHDAFVALWEKAADFQPDRGTAFSWVLTLTRNRAIDRVRSRKRRGELLGQSVPADLGYDEAGPHDSDGADTLWVQEKATTVRAAVAQLPPEQRTALELAYFGGLTQQEIAQKLSQPLGTVKARMRRGLLKLRDALAHRL